MQRPFAGRMVNLDQPLRGMEHSTTQVRLERQLRWQTEKTSLRCPLSGLAGILALAFVGGKLKPKSLLRVRDPLHSGHGNFELAIAKSAGSNCGDRPKPFGHPKITLWHGLPCRRQLGGRLSSLRIDTLRLKPWRGRLWFSYRSSVLAC
jgi:hypothetical protein